MYEKHVQDQRSLTDQLLALYALANRNGLYDAADYVRQHMAINRELTRRPSVVLDGREIAVGTGDAVQAAYRLLSGECERQLLLSNTNLLADRLEEP